MQIWKSNIRWCAVVRMVSLLLSGIVWSMVAPGQNISFRHIGLEEGLSETAGLCIHQDHLDRIWIGTRNGLNCWDGVNMKSFYPERGNVASLMEHKISNLCQADDYIWAQSSKGLTRLDLNTMQFARFYLDRLESMGTFNKQVLAGTHQGLLIYNQETAQFEAATEILPEKIQIDAIYQAPDKTLWLASAAEKKLVKIDENGRETIPIPLNDYLIVNRLLATSNNKLWIATRYHGILVYDLQQKNFETIHETSQPFFVPDLSVRDLAEDREGRLWVGTFKGLTVFDLTNKTCTQIPVSKTKKHLLNHNSVYSLCLSNDNNIWVGTYFGGVNYGRVSNQVFQKYHEMATNARPSHSVIGTLLEDEKGNIWIATEGGGVDYFNRKTHTFTNYPFANNESGLSETNIKSLFLHNNKQLLIGIYQGGLNLLDLTTNTIRHYKNAARKDYPIHVNSIIEYEGDFLLGTEKGVMRFNPKTEQFTPFFRLENDNKVNETVMVLYFDSKGVLWIGFEYDGLIAFDPKTNNQKHYTYNEFDSTTIASNSINCIVEDHRFRLWIGTDGGGFCLYDRNTDSFSSFNHQKNNLPGDFVYGIAESRFGNLWIATGKGLSRFDVENNLFYNYTSESGFPLNELNYKAILLTSKGELFVGGIDGLISFHERDLLNISENLRILFSGLYVNNKQVAAGNASKILEKDISVAESLVLYPGHTVFNIQYSSLNYNNTLNNKYQFQLVGFNDDWVDAEYRTSATYTNLNPGKYTFRVRATDVAYNPVSAVKSINVTVKPPFGKTRVAYVLYALLAFLIVALFNYFYLGKVRLQYQLKNERLEKERMEELNQYKLRFFTNISHEFMTPLTIIISALESVFSRYKVPGNLKRPLNLAMRNAKRLKNLNKELLDFRKIEQGHLKLKVQENELIAYLQEIYDAFEEMARHKNIAFNFINDTQHVSLFFDPVQMDKVFFNLLSNAFTHVPENTGRIDLVVSNNAGEVHISVSDNGKGIPKEDVEKVFNRFYQLDMPGQSGQYRGSGIGLALAQSIARAHQASIVCQSEPHKGTTFTVMLKKGTKHFARDQLCERGYEHHFDADVKWLEATKPEQETPAPNMQEDHVEDTPQLLIVDDNPEIRQVVAGLFEGQFRIHTANDGAEGLEKAFELQPDIIISDVLMPKLSGFEMCKKLKQNLNTSHIPVLMLTALDSEQDRTTAFKNGADSYCNKPFSPEMLKASVESLFMNRRIVQKKFNTTPGISVKTITPNRVDSDFLKRAQKIIDDNVLNPDFNVDEFAAKMQLGRTVFYSKVKTITGLTPNEYIQSSRLKKAAEVLMNDPSKNVSEVAYDTGFNSPRYFAMAFKKHFGVNPSKYAGADKK